jgi:PPP family 3-phenylpropionic acid transporter
MFNDATLSDEDLSDSESKDSQPSPTPAALPAAPAAEDALFLAYYQRDPHLLCHKAIYFLGMGANSAYFPFFVQWVTSPTVGLTVAQAGYVFAAAHICTMVASPLMMRLADQSAAWRRGVLICSIPTQIFLLWVMSQSRSFWSVLVVEVLQECMSCAIWPSMDAATQRLLEVVHGNTHLYGNTRAFGAIGWGLCAWIFGAIFDQYGMDVWWYLFAGTFAPAMLLATLVPVETRSASRASNGELLKRVWRWEVGVVVFVVLLTAVLLQIVDIYRFPFLASLPGCTNQLLGLSVAATAVSEAPFFFITSWVLARMSVKWALCLVLLGYFVRYIYYSLIYDPWLTIPAELM